MSRSGGFTLLELIVVLALLGLASALVGPPALRSIERWRTAEAFERVRVAVQSLPLAARRQGIRFEFRSNRDPRQPLGIAEPASMRLVVRRGWDVAPDGTCGDGELAVGIAGRERSLRIRAPYCHAEWADD